MRRIPLAAKAVIQAAFSTAGALVLCFLLLDLLHPHAYGNDALIPYAFLIPSILTALLFFGLLKSARKKEFFYPVLDFAFAMMIYGAAILASLAVVAWGLLLVANKPS